MGDLHVWHNGYDWVVATDQADARKVLVEVCGESKYEDDYDGDGWRMLADHEPLSITDDGGKERKTCGEWVAAEGRGHLCSTEC